MKKVLTFAAFCMLSAALFAQTPYSFFVSQEVSYDDNIYSEKYDEKDSGISTTKVGAKYSSQIPGSGLNLSAAAYGGYNYYTEDNGRNGYWEAGADLKLKNDIFSITEDFLYTSDPANNDMTDRAERLSNFVEFYAKSSASKPFSAAFKLSDKYDYYIDNVYKHLTRNRVNVGAELHYNLSGKTSVFAEYIFSDISYKDNDSNESYNQALGLGIEGDILNKLKGKAVLTYDMRNYRESVANTKDYESLFGYKASLVWEQSAMTKFGLSGHRNMEETIYTANRFYVSTSVDVFVSQKIFDKLTATLSLGYENMEYLHGDKRTDDFYKVRPSVDYQFQEWLSAGLWYQYRDRTSTVGGLEYDNNKVGAFVKAIF